MVTEPQRIAAVSLAHRVAEERGCPPPGAAGSSVGYMVRNDRLRHLPSCQIIYMTIGMLLKMLVLDRGGAAVAVDGVGNDDVEVVDDKVIRNDPPSRLRQRRRRGESRRLSRHRLVLLTLG